MAPINPLDLTSRIPEGDKGLEAALRNHAFAIAMFAESGPFAEYRELGLSRAWTGLVQSLETYLTMGEWGLAGNAYELIGDYKISDFAAHPEHMEVQGTNTIVDYMRAAARCYTLARDPVSMERVACKMHPYNEFAAYGSCFNH